MIGEINEEIIIDLEKEGLSPERIAEMRKIVAFVNATVKKTIDFLNVEIAESGLKSLPSLPPSILASLSGMIYRSTIDHLTETDLIYDIFLQNQHWIYKEIRTHIVELKEQAMEQAKMRAIN